ncbi:MAG: ATP synthase F1 subunit delta [Gaiellaceae bacterium]
MAAAQRRYAQALHEAASEQGRLDEVRAELASFIEIVRELPELRALMVEPELSPTKRVALLRDVLGESEQLLRNFVMLLAENGRLAELEEIASELEGLVADAERRLRVVLTTAQELTDGEAEGIIARIGKAAGRPVEATRRVDPSLIGGLVLHAGSLRLDASVRGRLERLRLELAHGSS